MLPLAMRQVFLPSKLTRGLARESCGMWISTSEASGTTRGLHDCEVLSVKRCNPFRLPETNAVPDPTVCRPLQALQATRGLCRCRPPIAASWMTLLEANVVPSLENNAAAEDVPE